MQLNLDYVIDRRLNDIIYALEVFGSSTLPNTAQAVERSANVVVGVWSQIASGAFKHASGRYLHAIENGKIYPYNNDRFHSAVINNLPYAKYIENGSGSYDMKNILNTSNKVRVSKKDGKRYLIIPFRHGTPGSVEFNPMPKAVHQAAKEMTPSRRTAVFSEPSQQGAKSYKEAQLFLSQGHPQGKTVTRNRYQWGGRLGSQDAGGKGSKYAGMVRFPRDDSTVGTKYMTFRVMKEGSSGWIRPAMPGMHLANKAKNASSFVIQRIITEGFEADKKMFLEMYL